LKPVEVQKGINKDI